MRALLTALSLTLGCVNCFSHNLSDSAAKDYLDKLWAEHVAKIKKDRAQEMADKVIRIGEHTMRFESNRYGEKPADGWNLFISLHGGGGTATKFNDSQWKNQAKLGDSYLPKNAIYLAPRAPSNSWDLWHRPHIDTFIDRLIENLVALEDVNPNAVYLMGYSAGGDGVYKLGPRMADRFAGAAMMAGHPNGASALSLRNLPFAIHVGANDGAYKRNEVSAKWKQQLEALHAEDTEGYKSQIKVHPKKGHRLDLLDQESIPWMQQFVRNSLPKKVVWKQDGVLKQQFYWLALPSGEARKGQLVVASIADQTITIEKSEKLNRLLVRLNDAMLDLDQPIKAVMAEGSILFEGSVARTGDTIRRTFNERRDRNLTFTAEILIELNR